MTQSRTVTYTNTLSNQEQTVTFPDYQSAARFVLSLHIAGVQAVVNLLPEDIELECRRPSVVYSSERRLNADRRRWRLCQHG